MVGPSHLPRKGRLMLTEQHNQGGHIRQLNARSTLDALTDSGIISDDAIITRITATKTYVPTCTDIGMRCTLEWEQ